MQQLKQKDAGSASYRYYEVLGFFVCLFLNTSHSGMAKINSNELITIPAAYKEGSCRQAPSARLPAGKTTTLENIKQNFFIFFSPL